MNVSARISPHRPAVEPGTLDVAGAGQPFTLIEHLWSDLHRPLVKLNFNLVEGNTSAYEADLLSR
jgi:hypothetical protein